MKSLLKSAKAIAFAACAISTSAADALPLKTTCDNLPVTLQFTGTSSSTIGSIFHLNEGETLVFSLPDPSQFQAMHIFMNGAATLVCTSPTECNGATFTFPSSAQEHISPTSVTTDPGGVGELVLSCLRSDGEDADAAASTASASSSAIRQSLSSAFSERNSGSGGSKSASQNRMFFSREADTGTYAWANFKATSFSGSLDGQGGEVTVGMDWQTSSEVYAGLLLSYGDYKISSNGTNFDNTAFSFGPYINAALSEQTQLEAFLAFASPQYGSGGSSYRSDRFLGGLTLRSDMQLGGTAFQGYVGYDGFSENLPAAAPGGKRTISSQTARLGARFDLNKSGLCRPFIRLGADATRFSDGATTSTSLAPSLGLGIEGDLKFGGYHLTLDGGEIFDGARITTLNFGINLTY